MKKERPILMCGAMVRAVLDGTKTQTRRIVKFPIIDRNGIGCEIACTEINSCLQQGLELCPYGIVGSKLWVRETFLNNALVSYPPVYLYRADGDDKPTDRKWKPSIFMPRAASRITLEITAVRVERLREISEKDAIAEGIDKRMAGQISMWRDYSGLDEVFGANPVLSYRSLWESINGKGSWVKNPWVWVVEFKRI